ncbi:uncharacterized protein BXZ73DRAFT_54856 [Epithele typhae]|uniref:uncharacterized protein n=1 Tax=Epithele typhae TaxID=378194 RepID=UPI0020089E0C|nr:uncharacterized protein BXZ73DRAFT_54856 [Epithele typhae]KAH9914647.1 hypothetical protein BXZ73DRAFT_54856 [Epithele typhae]
MFTKEASSIDKDQLRSSLRSKVSAFGAALKPKRHGQYTPEFALSTPQSERSTLVDFIVEDVLINEEDDYEYKTEEYMLDADNSAWGTGKYTIARVSKKSKRAPCEECLAPQSELLVDENTAWGAAVPQVSNKLRFRLFSTRNSQVQPAPATSGVEPEYLDPEDRAWM